MDAAIVPPGVLVNNKCYMLTGPHLEYLAILLNSDLFTRLILSSVNVTGGKGGDFLYSISLPKPTHEQTIEAKHLIAIAASSPEKEAKRIANFVAAAFGVAKPDLFTLQCSTQQG